MGFFKKIGKALGKVGKGVLKTAGGVAKSFATGATGGLSDKLLNAANNAAKNSFKNKGINPLDNTNLGTEKVDLMYKIKRFFQENWQKIAIAAGSISVLYFFKDKIMGGSDPYRRNRR